MRQVTVGLLWHSLDSSNLGVGALTASQIELVEGAASEAGISVRFRLIGWNADDERPGNGHIERVCQVNARRLLGRSPELWNALRECDLVLDIGEGDSFSDIYGWKRLVYLLGTKEIALRLGKPLILSPQTIGPFNGKLARMLADRVMGRARLVVTRDILSSDYFRSRRLDVQFNEAIDVAFALPYERSPKVSGVTRVGINVSALLWSGGYSGANQFGLKIDYRQVIREVIGFFSEQEGVKVLLVPHVVAKGRIEEDDLFVSQEVAREFTGIEVAGPFLSASKAKNFISGLDFFVGARMHACIAAFSSGVPVVPMAYSRKFSGLFNTLGYGHVADCQKENNEGVLRCIKQCFFQRESLVPVIEQGNRVAASRLDGYRMLLKQCLLETAHA